jgi:hypothetical protein
MSNVMRSRVLSREDVKELSARLEGNRRITDYEEWVNLSEKLLMNPSHVVGTNSEWIVGEAKSIGLVVKAARIESPYIYEIRVPESVEE